MNKEQAKEIVSEHILRSTEFRLERILFGKQLAFVQDPRPFKTAVCSRRSGKTVACAADLLHTCITNKEVTNLYITTSRSNAKRIVWPELQRLNERYHLGGVEDLTDLSLHFHNGSKLYLSGAKDASEIEKFRGLALKSVYIDETQAFRPHIEELINDVIAPATMDYSGSISLIGTPGPIPAGYFYKCAVESPRWSHHAWTFFDNPHMVKKSGLSHQKQLDRQLEMRGVGADHPGIQREYFGRWVLDPDALLLHYDEAKNHYDTLPLVKWNYLMGIDLGFNDADAIAILAWSEAAPATYLVHESIQAKQGLTELVREVERLRSQFDISKLVIDEGGLGKKIAEEMRRRFHIPVQPADKARKMENIAFLNDALRTERFKAKKNSRFAQDSYLVEIDRDKSTPDKIAVSNSYHSDIIDAVLYAFKESPSYTYREPVLRPKRGTQAWYEEEEDAIWKHEFERAEEEKQKKEWIQEGW